jgi:hypothetical protein
MQESGTDFGSFRSVVTISNGTFLWMVISLSSEVCIKVIQAKRVYTQYLHIQDAHTHKNTMISKKHNIFTSIQKCIS